MELVLDIEKGVRTLNRGKLIRKPVQVRGKNGKIFTRMQWVDPNTGQPVQPKGSQAEQAPKEKAEPTISPEKTKKKTYDLNTREGFIDHHVDHLSKEDKQALVQKHQLEWTHNDHEMIDHKNMVVALKEHLKGNPHLVGAEHLPNADEGIKSPSGVDRDVNFLNNLGKSSPEKLYDLMRECGVIEQGAPDPRTQPEYGPKPDGNGMGPIMHMKNMMALKRYLKENPDFTPKSDLSSETIHPTTGEKVKETIADHKADKDITIKDVMNRMSREEKYALAKQLGISEQDPRDIPQLADNNAHSVQHARNMSKLASLLERDPSILDLDKYDLSEEDKGILIGKSDHKHMEDNIKSVVRDMPMKMRAAVYNKFSKDPSFPPVPKIDSDNPNAKHIRNMHLSTSIQKFFSQNPDKYEPYKKEVNNLRLEKLPMGNKLMARALKHFFGLKGVGDVLNNHDEESGEREWTFGAANDSWARVERRGDGVMLSVVDTGKDGGEWNEYTVPMEKVRSWIESGEPETQEEHLHNKPIKDIESALHRNFNHYYTPEVGDAMRPILTGAWEAAGYPDDPEEITKYFNSMNASDIGKLCEKYGMPLKEGKFNTKSTKWKNFMWGNLVEDTKSKNAHDYVFDVNGKPELYVLHESASHWNPEERAQARMEILGKDYKVNGLEGTADEKERSEKLLGLIHKGTEFVPFDLLSDMMITNGIKIRVSPTDHTGNTVSGSKYDASNKTLYLDHSFATNDSLMHADHPLDLLSSSGKTHTMDNGEEVEVVPTTMGDDLAHEIGHAIHYHLSEGDTRNGVVNPTGKKYLGEHTGAISASYNTAMRTNPRHYVGEAFDSQGNHAYYYHKDHWIDSYEGRIYGDKYHPDNPNNPIKSGHNGNLVDSEYSNTLTGHAHGRGMEHFAHSVSRYANALGAYQRYRESNPGTTQSMEEWAHDMAESFRARGYGTDGEALRSHREGYEGDPVTPYKEDNAHYTYEDEANGFLYDTMCNNHKSMTKAVDRLLNRSDFQSKGIDTGAVSDRYSEGDFTRKSEVLLYIGGNSK